MTEYEWLIVFGVVYIAYVILVFCPFSFISNSPLACPRCGKRGRILGTWRQVPYSSSWSALKCDHCGAAWNKHLNSAGP